MIIVFCLSTKLFAQQATAVFNLKQCIALALKNNINITQRELNQQTANADYFQSKMSLLPNLNGTITNNYNTGFAINPTTNSTQRDVTFRSNNFSLNSSVTLFNGFQNTNNLRMQRVNVQAVNFEVAAAKNNLALQVANAYMQVLLSNELLNARKFQTDATKTQAARQQKMFELGAINKVKLLQVNAQLANEEAQVVAAQAQLDQAYLTLWQLINIAPTAQNTIATSDSTLTNVDEQLPDANDVYAKFAEKSPEIIAAKKRLESSRIAYQMALGGRGPRLTLSAGLNSFYTTQSTRGTGTPTQSLRPIGIDSLGIPVYSSFVTYGSSEVVPFNEQFDRNLGKSIGFNLSIPIFNGWQVNTNIQKQRINQTNNNLIKQQAELDVFKNINQAVLDAKSAQKKYAAAVISYQANKDAYLLADSQFSLGALNTADYMNTKNQFLQAETSLLQAKFELIFRKKVIDFYLGKDLY